MRPDTLLPGEDPDTTFPDDVVHWLKVYGELLELKQELLSRTDSLLPGMTVDAQQDAQIDRRLLKAQAERYQARHAFWVDRAAHFAEADGHPGGISAPRSGRRPV